MNPTGEVTELLLEAGRGEQGAMARLFELLYADLRRIADDRLRRESSGHTLQPTALVHEAYLRLVDQTRCRWQNRAQFLAVASQAMRRILVDHARGKQRKKRGGEWSRAPLEEALNVSGEHGEEHLIALDIALRKLESVQPEKARVVEMRYFGGLTNEECAEVLQVSARTVIRYWDYAQAWLYREMTSEPAA